MLKSKYLGIAIVNFLMLCCLIKTQNIRFKMNNTIIIKFKQNVTSQYQIKKLYMCICKSLNLNKKMYPMGSLGMEALFKALVSNPACTKGQNRLESHNDSLNNTMELRFLRTFLL